jgi:DNA-binding transcriptional regulator YiaG
VYLKVNGIPKTVKVHRLVAITHINNPLDKPQVNHKDGCKTNNSIDNLEWSTCKENIIHSVQTKLRIANKGSKHGQSKLTEDSVKDIRSRYAAKNVTQKVLADEYGVSFQTISDVVNRKLWNHV